MSAFNCSDMLLCVINFQLENQIPVYFWVKDLRNLEQTARVFRFSPEMRPLLKSYMEKAKVPEFTHRLFTAMFEEATATAVRIQAVNDDLAAMDESFRDLRSFVLYCPGRGNVFYSCYGSNSHTYISQKVTLNYAPDSIVLHFYRINIRADIRVSALSDRTMFKVDVHAINLLSGRQFDAGFKLRTDILLTVKKHVSNNLYH